MNQPLPLAALPLVGRIAAIDYGTVRIGVAASDPDQKFAMPLETYTRRTPADDHAWLVRLVREERFVGLVIGLPLHTDGGESQKSCEARAFARWAAEITGTPVVLYDERYTTAQAESLLLEAGLTSKRRKERRDKLAAQILLASFLESTRANEGGGPIGDSRR
jgi:putative Holliday junction resolvase